MPVSILIDYYTRFQPEFFNFPGGERHVRLDPAVSFKLNQADPKPVIIDVSYKGDQDLIDLMLTVDAIRSISVPSSRFEVGLNIPYFPYARQDRIANPGEAFSLRAVAKFINSLDIDWIIVADPHSDVLGALFPAGKLRVLTQAQLFSMRLKNVFDWKTTALLSPDVGALKKIFALSSGIKNYCDDGESIQPEIITLFGEKYRDPLTGNISGVDISNPALFDYYGIKDVVIVDDICDGGRTFTELAKAVRKYSESRIHLFVTHGIFSKGMEVFEEHFSTVTCLYPEFKEVKFD